MSRKGNSYKEIFRPLDEDEKICFNCPLPDCTTAKHPACPLGQKKRAEYIAAGKKIPPQYAIAHNTTP